jgi:DHA3 family macrolide efflux protein-like MFS transporter
MRNVLVAGQANVHRISSALFYREGTNIFTVLRVEDFRHLWTGQMISFVGDALAYNTLTLAIIRMANDEGVSAGRLLSLLFVLSALPPLFLGMVAGTIVDRANRKRMMIAADIIRGFLVLGFLLVGSLDQVWIFVVVSICLSAVSTFFYPARTAMLPQILDKHQLLAANAMAQLTSTLSFVVGAAIAGVMVGLTQTTAPAFVADSISFFVSAYFIARISISGKIERDAPAATAQTAREAIQPVTRPIISRLRTLRAMLDELLVGLRYVLTDQIMRGVLISFLALMLGLGAANVTFVPLLINELGMREEGLGLIRFSQTMGIILSSAVIASIAARYKARDLIGLSMIAFGVMTIIVSAVTNYALMVGVLFLVGLAISPPQIVASTLMQRHVPSEKLGRASGAQGTIVNVANIASMGAAGFLMDEIGARNVFLGAGILIFSAGFVSWWVLRDVESAPEEMDEARPATGEYQAAANIIAREPVKEAGPET